MDFDASLSVSSGRRRRQRAGFRPWSSAAGGRALNVVTVTLTFHLGRIPVRVHPAFWFMALILGGGATGANPAIALLWIAVVFGSVLLHELGHAVAGITFGLDPAIDLHGFGGTTSWRHKDVSRAKKIVISVAGPLVGIVLGGALKLGYETGAIPAASVPRLGQAAIALLVYANLWWGALNLIPMLPLDGGNVMAQLVPVRVARIASIVIGVPLAVLAFLYSGVYGLVLVGYLVVTNVRALMADRAPPPAAPPPPAADPQARPEVPRW